MSGYSKILVAVDGSDESAKILAAATAQAGGDASRLSVIMVFEPLPTSYNFELNMADLELAIQEQQEKISAQLRLLVAEKCPGISTEALHFVRGKPSHEIRELAEKLGCDLLVIGSHGQGAIRSLLGSTASAVLHGIECDVLTVRV